MTQPYQNMSELTLRANKGVEYAVSVHDRSSPVTLVAIHAGHIEPLTGELASAIAGNDHNLYLLCGLDPQSAARLRVPVTRFDDVRLTTLAERSVAAISLQGIEGQQPRAHLGGANRRLREHIGAALEAAGIATAGPAGRYAAHSPARFVNRAAQGGVQIELTHALRQAMVSVPLAGDSPWQDPDRRTPRFGELVDAVRQGLSAYLTEQDTDLEVALQRFEEATREIRRVIPLGDDNGHAGCTH
ncbi:MAG: hypothetical protein GX649_07675 [Chloroflexi bacterium]|nr:hypothetical protein [Chloroflexota bacterium]